jgi:hypothetical protein
VAQNRQPPLLTELIFWLGPIEQPWEIEGVWLWVGVDCLSFDLMVDGWCMAGSIALCSLRSHFPSREKGAYFCQYSPFNRNLLGQSNCEFKADQN